MTNNSSKALTQKRKELDLRESKIKDELEVVSSHLEKRLKNGLVVVATISGITLSGYAIYKAFTKNGKKNKVESIRQAPESSRQSPNKKVVRPKISVKNILIERVLILILNLSGKVLSNLLTKNANSEDKG